MIHKFTLSLRPAWLWRKHLVLRFKFANWTQGKTVFHIIERRNWKPISSTHPPHSPFLTWALLNWSLGWKVSNALKLPKAQHLCIMFFSLEADLSKAQPSWPISTPPWDQGSYPHPSHPYYNNKASEAIQALHELPNLTLLWPRQRRWANLRPLFLWSSTARVTSRLYIVFSILTSWATLYSPKERWLSPNPGLWL